MDKNLQKRREIAARIAFLLKEKGWTQQQLAESTGLTKSYVSEILNEKHNLTIEMIVRLETALRGKIITVPSE